MTRFWLSAMPCSSRPPSVVLVSHNGTSAHMALEFQRHLHLLFRKPTAFELGTKAIPQYHLTFPLVRNTLTSMHTIRRQQATSSRNGNACMSPLRLKKRVTIQERFFLLRRMDKYCTTITRSCRSEVVLKSVRERKKTKQRKAGKPDSGVTLGAPSGVSRESREQDRAIHATTFYYGTPQLSMPSTHTSSPE